MLVKTSDMTPHERIGRIGEKVIQVIEDEDPVEVLSALTLLTASTCAVIAGDNPAAMHNVAEGFVETFRDVVASGSSETVVIH